MKSPVNKILVPLISATLLNLACAGNQSAKNNSHAVENSRQSQTTNSNSQSENRGYATDRESVGDTLKLSSLIRIIKPKDGGVIRRSVSMLDPIDVCAQVDSTIDTDKLLKVEYYHSRNCRDSLDYHLFAIESGYRVENGLDCINWWNTDDLAWIDKNGREIYLWATMYLDEGDSLLNYTSPCSKVRVDIKTPPLCLWTNWAQFEQNDRIDYDSWRVDTLTLNTVANFIVDVDNYNRDTSPNPIDSVSLYIKKSSDADKYLNWSFLGNGVYREINEPFARNYWSVFANLTNLEEGFYDVRAVAMLRDGHASWDLNRDWRFDDNTFDPRACDMNTYWIENGEN